MISVWIAGSCTYLHVLSTHHTKMSRSRGVDVRIMRVRCRSAPAIKAGFVFLATDELRA